MLDGTFVYMCMCMHAHVCACVCVCVCGSRDGAQGLTYTSKYSKTELLLQLHATFHIDLEHKKSSKTGTGRVTGRAGQKEEERSILLTYPKS